MPRDLAQADQCPFQDEVLAQHRIHPWPGMNDSACDVVQTQAFLHANGKYNTLVSLKPAWTGSHILTLWVVHDAGPVW